MKETENTIRTFLLDKYFRGQVFAANLALLDKLWNFIEKLLCLFVVLERDITAGSNKIVCSVAPKKSESSVIVRRQE